MKTNTMSNFCFGVGMPKVYVIYKAFFHKCTFDDKGEGGKKSWNSDDVFYER